MSGEITFSPAVRGPQELLNFIARCARLTHGEDSLLSYSFYAEGRRADSYITRDDFAYLGLTFLSGLESLLCEALAEARFSYPDVPTPMVAVLKSRVSTNSMNMIYGSAYSVIWPTALAICIRKNLFLYEYDAITYAWRTIIGPLHPDDPEAQLTPAGLIAWQGIAKANPEWSLEQVTDAVRLVME